MISGVRTLARSTKAGARSHQRLEAAKDPRRKPAADARAVTLLGAAR